MIRAAWFMLALSCMAICSATARARVERFAIVVGNNRGLPSDVELRYAEADAARVAEVMQELGGVAPANTVLLTGRNADTLRSTLITVNDRIRSAVSQPDTDVLLLVYYSGHADAETLHLGDTTLPTAELAQLVRGSAATFRLLIMDACRSGQLTRRKGGTLKPPFTLAEEPRLAGEGLAFLTASSADEDAQESDELRGSFFTHALVSGLLGVADADGDGAIVLEEAYRYAYDATLRSTSRTAYGTQHPTFHYDLRGQGQLVLTEARLGREQRGILSVGAQVDALIFRDSAQGPVVAEVAPGSQARSLSVAPGAYFVRVRGGTHLLEGLVNVSAGSSTYVDTREFSRIEYARLVRKGAGQGRAVHGLELAGRARSALPNAATLCAGAALGYRLDRERVSLVARLGFCSSRFENAALEARVRELDLGLRLGHAWDLSVFTLELGAGAAVSAFEQRFESNGSAPARRSLAGHASLFAALLCPLKRGFYVGLEAEPQLYVLPLREGRREALRAAYATRGGIIVGKHL